MSLRVCSAASVTPTSKPSSARDRREDARADELVLVDVPSPVDVLRPRALLAVPGHEYARGKAAPAPNRIGRLDWTGERLRFLYPC